MVYYNSRANNLSHVAAFVEKGLAATVSIWGNSHIVFHVKVYTLYVTAFLIIMGSPPPFYSVIQKTLLEWVQFCYNWLHSVILYIIQSI